MESNINSLSIIDQGDMVSFKKTMQKINQWQSLVQQNLKKDKDYGIIPGTSKPTLYKPGAEKIVMLGKLRSTFDILDETKDYEKEFFQFEVRWNLWAGENLICQGVGLCSSKEDKYRYRWVSEKKLPSNIKKDNLVDRVKTGKYGEYKQYRIENEDICSIANTILKMAKKRALIDAALLVGSLSELFTQDTEDLPEEYLGNDKPNSQPNSQPNTAKKVKDEPASEKQIYLIDKQILGSHLMSDDEKDRLRGLIENGMSKTKASATIGWWKGDDQKGILGEREKRAQAEKVKPTKEEKIELARHIAGGSKLELKDGKKGLLDDDGEPGSSPDNAIPYKGKKKKVSNASDFINEEEPETDEVPELFQ